MVAVLGVAGLTGCRSNPTVAAYVGGKQYTQKDIATISDELATVIGKLPVAQRQGITLAVIRHQVVQTVVMGDLADKVAADNHVQVKELSAEELQMADTLAHTRWGLAQARFESRFVALANTAPALAPTEADQRAAYLTLTDQNGPLKASFNEVRSSLTQELLGQRLGMRDLLVAGVHRYHVVVNPKYAPLDFRLTFQLGSAAEGYVAVPFETR